MDNGGPYAAPADALNLFQFSVTTFAPPVASFTFIKQINVAAFDSIFPCAPTSRDCIPQSGTAQKVDILSYRQRPLHRLAYRNFLSYDGLFTNQSIDPASQRPTAPAAPPSARARKHKSLLRLSSGTGNVAHSAPH